MPYIRTSESYNEDGEMLNPVVEYAAPNDYRYKDCNEDFRAQESKLMELLRSVGASELLVCYDGGNDEGFSQVEGVRIGGEKKPLDGAIAALNTPENVSCLRSSMKHSAYYDNMPAEELLRQSLEELAEAFAERLLGEGYGTGEYDLAGAFSANLATLEMVDDCNARPADWK